VRLDAEEARRRFTGASVARLATVSAGTAPHLVPMVFAVDGDVVYTAVDAKPKSTTALRRLSNIDVNPRVSILVDHYVDDWRLLWWVRADGTARRGEDADLSRAITLLTLRYPQYRDEPPSGPAIVVHIDHWSGWRASDDA